jgi:hypothetical protein
MWELLDKASGKQEQFERLLAEQPKEALVEFYNEFIQAASHLRYELSKVLRSRSDDAQKDIVEYIVAQGKERYTELLAHPERVPEDVDPNDVWVKGLVIGVYWDRFQDHIPRWDLGESL